MYYRGHGGDRFGFRLVHFSVQSNHLHLIAEADGRDALRRGVQGLCIRVAKSLNRLVERAGSVFSDRYHMHVLRSPLETRRCLAYVLLNSRKHAAQQGRRLSSTTAIDPCSTGAGFKGWLGPVVLATRLAAPHLPQARSWMLRIGWKKHGLISPSEIPRG